MEGLKKGWRWITWIKDNRLASSDRLVHFAPWTYVVMSRIYWRNSHPEGFQMLFGWSTSIGRGIIIVDSPSHGTIGIKWLKFTRWDFVSEWYIQRGFGIKFLNFILPLEELPSLRPWTSPCQRRVPYNNTPILLGKTWLYTSMGINANWYTNYEVNQKWISFWWTRQRPFFDRPQ